MTRFYTEIMNLVISDKGHGFSMPVNIVFLTADPTKHHQFVLAEGRIIAAGGPFLVGAIASQGAAAASSALSVLFYVGFIPLIGLLLNIISDISYTLVDPRIDFEGR